MTTPDAFRDAEHIADISDFPFDDNPDRSNLTPLQLEQWLRRKKEVQARAKMVFLDNLLRDYDVLVYAQLSILYYMDNSVVHLIIRAVIQNLFFTPRRGFVFEDPNAHPFLGAIIIGNFLCFLLHYISAIPTAGEVSRGYLHGGLFIDFIGQKAPISRLRLFSMDSLFIVIQVIMLSIILEKGKTRSLLPRPPNRPGPSEDTVEAQDIDAEERGVIRSDQPPAQETVTGDIELQDLSRPPRRSEDEDGGQPGPSTGTLDDEGQSDVESHPWDKFLSGDMVVLEMGFLGTIREQWQYNINATSIAHQEQQPRSTTASRSRSPRMHFFQRTFGVYAAGL